MKTLSVIKKKLCSMRYSKKEVQKETSQDAKQFMYGYTECINDLLEYINFGGDGLPEHDLFIEQSHPENRIEKITRLSKKREEFTNYLLRRMLKEDREAQRIKNFETDIAFLETDMEDQSEQSKKPEKLPVCKYCGLKEPTAMEMIKEVFEPIQLPENEVVNQALELASKKAGKEKHSDSDKQMMDGSH